MINKNSQNYHNKEIVNVVNPAVLNYIKVNDRLNDTAGFIVNNIFSINNNAIFTNNNFQLNLRHMR